MAENRLDDPATYLKPPEEQVPVIELEETDNSPPIPEKEIDRRSFYSAFLEDDATNFKDNYINTRGEMQVSGTSPLYDKHLSEWKAEQALNMEADVDNILLDPTVPTQQKIQLINLSKSGALVSEDLEDKYAQKVASDEAQHITKADAKSQDNMIVSLNDTMRKQKELEDIKFELAHVNNPELSDILIGTLRDVLPGVWTAENTSVRVALSQVMGDSIKQSVNAAGRTIFAAGHTNAEIGRILDNTLDPDQKKLYIQAMGKAIEGMPGNVYNKWAQAQDKIFQGQMGPAETWIETAIGWWDAFSLGKAVLSPIKFLRHAALLQPSDAEKAAFGKVATLVGLKQPEPFIKQVDPATVAKAEEAKADKASNAPTGEGFVGPVQPKEDSITSSSIAAKKEQKDVVKDRKLQAERSRLENLGLPEDVINATLGIKKESIAPSDGVRIQELERNISGLEKLKSENPDRFGKTHQSSLDRQKTELKDLQSKIVTSEDKDISIVLSPEIIGKDVQPSISPASPLGVTQAASPTATRKLAVESILDPGVARATGNEPGQIAGSFALEKIDDDFIKNHPDIAKDLEEWDKKFNKRYDDTSLDPYLIDTVERTKDKEILYRTFTETQGGYYQAANSTLSESLGKAEGRARFGRNADFGFNTHDEALNFERNVKEQFTDTPNDTFKTTIAEENGQWFVDLDWTKQYDPFSSKVFGLDSTDSKFFGFNTSEFTRGGFSKHIFPPTTRLPEWVTKAAFLTSTTALRTQELFSRLLKDIIKTPLKKELNGVLNYISENQRYLKEGDIASMYPHLDAAGRKDLMRSQYLWKRLSDYMHNIVNRAERRVKDSKGIKGIYKSDGTHLGNGKQIDSIPKTAEEVWNFDLGIATKTPKDLQGKILVELDVPISRGNSIYRYAVLGGNQKLDILPANVVPKIEGYVPRFNIENYYIKAHPKTVRVDGRTISDVNELRNNHTKTIGAAKDKKDAIELVKNLQEELGDDFVVSWAQERSDIGDAIVTDYKVFKEKTDYGKVRGDRLPTLNGFARLEDPLVAADKRIKTLARLDAWKDYDEIFQKNFMQRFAAYLPTGEFPSTLHDLKLPKDFITEEVLKSYQVAQRLLEQYTNSRYKLNMSDIVWKTMGHKLADRLEGFFDNMPSQITRDIANKGDLFRKGSKSLSTNLFLNLGFTSQWIVQPQVILPFAMMEKGFRDSMHMLPALLIDILSRASDAKPYKKAFDHSANIIAGTNNKEFRAIADAIYEVGLPQGVDLNIMLHGGLDEIAKPLVRGFGGTVYDTVTQAVSLPGKAGKVIGHTPAQMLADMAGFLFAKARWEKMNPGKNWNTPQNIRQIAADGWDIMGSMSSRAGVMPFQDGYLGVLFQFQAVLLKNMFTLFSSKTLKKAPGELIDPRLKFAGANAAIFGVYGVPASALIYNMWDDWFGEETDPNLIAKYQEYRGGLLDLVSNSTLDMFLQEATGQPIDLAISKRIGPMSDTLPYVDLMWDMYGFMTGNKTDNPRFPFVNAAGSIYDAVRDTYNLVSVAPEINTVEALQMFGVELAEATSAFNNYGKAAAILEFQDKKNKFGNNLGLELTETHAIAQLFGVTSQKEVNLYEAIDNKKEREEYINDRVTKILLDMEKLRDKIGTPDWIEHTRRMHVLNQATRAPDREEVALEVMRRDKMNWLTQRESMMKYIADHYKAKNDKDLSNMIANFKNGTPKEKAFIEMLERNIGSLEQQQ